MPKHQRKRPQFGPEWYQEMVVKEIQRQSKSLKTELAELTLRNGLLEDDIRKLQRRQRDQTIKIETIQQIIG